MICIQLMAKLKQKSPRKAPWHSRAVRRTADWMEKLSLKQIVQVGSTARGSGRSLSNFTPAPFRLDGVNYPSFEAFWQSLKFEPSEPMRHRVAQMRAGEAKRAGSQIRTKIMFYGGRILSYGSKELVELAKRAERERFSQNSEQMHALMNTGNAILIHWVEARDSKSLPRRVFCKILMELRDEFRNRK